MARVFLTGGSGFLGRHVRTVLERRGHHVTSLVRSTPAAPNAIVGDLTVPSTYCDVLPGMDVVVHLAAVTGRAQEAEYARVNVEGTRALIDAARRAGVTRFLFCSTIAVTFPDIARYPYARSKVEGEQLVRHSGLRTTTVRPTIIGGPGSPVVSKLASLAGLPIVPLFGGGRTRVQPILATDLAELVGDVVDLDRFDGEVLDLGGRDVVTMRELLTRLRTRTGRPAPRFLTVPLSLLIAPLTVLEPIVGHALPMTIGQLATFRFDGVARSNTLVDARRERLAPLDVLLADVAEPHAEEATTEVLERECRTFAKAIADIDASAYVVGKYLDAHRVHATLARPRGFDAALVEWARSSPLVTRLADAYARHLMPRGTLRKKLVLLLAVLETSPGTHRSVELPASRSRVAAAASLALAGLTGVVALAVGFVLFGTLRLVSRAPRP